MFVVLGDLMGDNLVEMLRSKDARFGVALALFGSLLESVYL